ncbi:sensor histidine kinase [Dongia sedimenti]|uniref:histidine kinase n=1 Tax=Dongia sedimenti TaxID=3064282 RepID=A0ABU0YPB7_9PROT|nr:histidine kinase dimerization/phosphoacceptor domain -containing protein [Rhodospirillaceae bacterium R-7]
MGKGSKQSGSDDLEAVRQHVRILCDLGRLAGNSTDLQTFLQQAVAQVARGTEIHHVKILRYRPETADLLVVAGTGWKPGVVGTATLSADLRSAPGRAFQTGEAISIKNFEEQGEYDLSPLLKEHGIVSLVNAPVLIGGSAWGVVEVDSTTPREFGPDTCDFLTAAGALIGTCIRRHTAPSQADTLATAMLQAQQREILLREMQHRVKNSFQLIIGAITLQKRRHTAPEVLAALDYTAERIRAVSLAHEQLAPRAGGEAINLADYLRALCLSIKSQVENVEIDIAADEVHMPIERAIALGLILNEAATNSLKHAFGDGDGHISVKLQAGIGFGEARLTIADDGHGMKDPTASGSGLKLIGALARQIAATVERTSSDKGTIVSVQFPVIS